MAYPVKTPKKGLSADSVIINEWFVEEGQDVKKGDLILSVETNKAVIDVEAENEGIILKIFFEEGEEVPVLTNVAIIGEEGEDFSELYPDQLKDDTEKESEEKVDKPDTKEVSVEKDEDSLKKETGEKKTVEESSKDESQFDKRDVVKISPRAEKLASKHDIEFSALEGTGPEGRIIERDIEKAISEGGVVESRKVEGDYEDVEISNMRKIIADNMYQSVSSTAQLTLNTSFDAGSILNYRKKIKENESIKGLEDISINDLILFTVARTLLNYKNINAHMLENKIRQFNNVHLGLAVHTEKGLMVPTLFDADSKTLSTISRESSLLADKCKEGSIEPEYLEGATFTVTNLGAMGVETFNPILNPPQVGILGVNTVEYKIKKEGDEFITYPAMSLSLTFDHRAVDGKPAAEFLKELKENLEKVELILSL